MKVIPTQTLAWMRMSTNWIKISTKLVRARLFVPTKKYQLNTDIFGKLQLLHGLVS